VVVTHTGYQDPALRARKAQRDLRILRLDLQQHPGDPFILFNLGSIYQEMGRHEEALACLRQSLDRSHPTDSIVRKLYALIALSLSYLNRLPEAVNVCRQGRAVVPDDAELLFREGILLRDLGNLVAAEACQRELLATRSSAQFASVSSSLRGWLGRYELAVTLRKQKRHDEARALWQQVTRECPDYLPAWLGLAEIALITGDTAGLEEVARSVEALLGGRLEAEVLRARGLMARADHHGARAILERLIAEHPQAVAPREILSHTYLQEGNSREAEQALRNVLLLDPCHPGAQHNLSLLLSQKLRGQDAYFDARSDLMGWLLGEHYQAACTTPSELQEHLPCLHELACDCKHVTDTGTGEGLAGLAFLWAQPDRLVCVDILRSTAISRLEVMAGRTKLVFRQEDLKQVELEETDLLFVGSKMEPEAMARLTNGEAAKVRRYLVLHGTSDEGRAHAAEALIASGVFRLDKRYENNGGLLVLARVTPQPA
jgi:tetratricopeptide (TPR) repeat protein